MDVANEHAHAVFTPEMEKDLAGHEKLRADMFHQTMPPVSFAAENKPTVPSTFELKFKS